MRTYQLFSLSSKLGCTTSTAGNKTATSNELKSRSISSIPQAKPMRTISGVMNRMVCSPRPRVIYATVSLSYRLSSFEENGGLSVWLTFLADGSDVEKHIKNLQSRGKLIDVFKPLKPSPKGNLNAASQPHYEDWRFPFDNHHPASHPLHTSFLSLYSFTRRCFRDSRSLRDIFLIHCQTTPILLLLQPTVPVAPS